MTTSLGTETANTPMPGVGTISAEDYGSRQRGGKLWLRLGLASFIVLVLAVLAWGSWALTQSAKALADVDTFAAVPRSFNVVLKEKGELKAARSTDINCEVEGRSTIITLIPEGTAVKQGDLLVELASDEIDNSIRQEELKEANAITAYESAQTELEIQRDKNASDVRKAELEIELKRLELEKYQKGDWEQMLKDHTIAIDQAELNLKRRKEDFSAAQELRAKDFITKTEYEEDEFNKLKAEWDLDKAKKALEVLKAYTHVAALRKRQSDLDEAVKECARVKKNADAEELKKVRDVEGKKKELDLTQDELADLRAQKEKTRITAPTQGFVVYFSGGGRRFWSSDDQIKVGATVHERQTLLSLPDTSEMLVVLRVHEAKTDKLRLGQPAKITVEGLPGHEFTG
ncbi:MAG: efflux RND transporter periplasmic adaptor subunit, partial [Phycisphaerae bacterium]